MGGTIRGIAVSTARAAWRKAAALMLAGVPALPSALVAQQLTIPPPTGLVSDFAHVLDSGTIQRITRVAEDVRMKSRGEIAVVTLSDIGGREATDVALQIGREWKVGKIGDPGDPTRNAGAVILLVPKETSSDGRGRCFIATGRGTEGFITDATAGDICREATPAFRERDYATGLELVALRTAERFASEFNFSIDTALVPPVPLRSERDSDGGFPPALFFILFFVIMTIISNARRRGRKGRRGRDGCGGGLPLILPIPVGRRGWSSGSSWGGGGFGGGGGGFGGFGGGGGFSGGGGGSSW